MCMCVRECMCVFVSWYTAVLLSNHQLQLLHKYRDAQLQRCDHPYFVLRRPPKSEYCCAAAMLCTRQEPNKAPAAHHCREGDSTAFAFGADERTPKRLMLGNECGS